MTESKGEAKGEQTACCVPSEATTPQVQKRRVGIDFLFLDLTACGRCRGTDQQLEEALTIIAPVLEATGVEVHPRKIHVQSEEQAAALGFVVSPTIRVNNRDIQLNWRESPCESCGKLCGCEGEVSCREWEYQGQWYTVPPKALIISAILGEVFGAAGEGVGTLSPTGDAPENLKRFFSGQREKQKR